MSTHLPGFQSYFICFHHFVLAKLATSSIRDKESSCNMSGIECNPDERVNILSRNFLNAC